MKSIIGEKYLNICEDLYHITSILDKSVRQWQFAVSSNSGP